MEPTETLDTLESHAERGRRETARAFLVVSDRAHSRVLDLPDGGELTFGRAIEASLRIEHDKVSRVHARITRRGGTVTVHDLASRNGVLVNDRRIDGALTLAPGDEVAIGPATLTLGFSSSLRRRRGLISAAHLEQRLVAEVDRARRYRRSLGLVMLRLEGEPTQTDKAVESLLHQLRRMDEVAEYTSDELAIVLPEAGVTELSAAVSRLLAAVALEGVTVYAGYVSYPQDGSHAEALLSAARDALRTSRGGRPRPSAVVAGVDAVDGPLVFDPQMQRLYANLARVASSALTVLVLGETGVGKEFAAEAVHRGSTRRAGPLVRINCASLSESLLESELFGYERGAFTGAERRKVGYFEAANGGTLFLDEVGEMPLGLQAKLLRVLERRAIVRVGSTTEVSIDVRVVAATNRDLEREIARGTFREDLYYRISGFTVVVPPLRDRPAEILPLAQRFLRTLAHDLGQAVPELSAAASRALLHYSWPGNVRELRNAMERALALHTDGIIDVAHLSERHRDVTARPPMDVAARLDPAQDIGAQVAALERTAVIAALETCDGNQTQAARKLGITRRALLYKLEKYGLRARPAP